MVKKKQSFAEAYEELQALTAWFERGEPDLDQGLEKMTRAKALAAELKERLLGAETVVHQMTEKDSSSEEAFS
jgi:exodeoxyribonuclease VII small subunit